MSTRYQALDGWRGLAAVAITFYHIPIDHALRPAENWKNIEVFVDLFFVLSGFVIGHAWRARLRDARQEVRFSVARTFMLRRFWRVWPLHIAVLAIFLAIECAKLGLVLAGRDVFDAAPFTGYTSVPALFSNIFLVQSLGLHGSSTWNAPAWSISVEFWVYVVFALVMLFVSRWAIFVSLVLAVSGAVVLALFSDLGLLATHDFGFFRGLLGFFLGVVTQAIIVARSDRPKHGTAREIGVVLVLVAFLVLAERDAYSLLAPVIFAGLVGVFAQGSGVLTRIFETDFAQKLGLWSYSIYMIHVLLFSLLRLGLVAIEKALGVALTVDGTGGNRIFSFGAAGWDWLAIGVLIGVSIALSSVSYRIFERPFMAGTRQSAR